MEIKDAPIFSKVSKDILFLIRQVARTQSLTVSEYVRFLILTDLKERGLIDAAITSDAMKQFSEKVMIPA